MDSDDARLHPGRYSTSSRDQFASPPNSPLLGYHESDPFLASRSHNGARSPSPSRSARSPSPGPFDRSTPPSPSTRLFDHIIIPPQAKRNKSKAVLLVGVAALVVLTTLAAHAAGGLGAGDGAMAEKVQAVSEKVKQSLGGWREGWSRPWNAEQGTEVQGGADGPEDEASGKWEENNQGGVTHGEGGTYKGGKDGWSPLAKSPASSPSPSSLPDTSPPPINISTFPSPLRIPSGDPNERYLGFLPHSGVHNQRMELQNALLLGKLLNRTVLIPPVWVGWPTPTQHYDDLALAWTHAISLNPSSFGLSPSSSTSFLNTPASYASTKSSYPFPTSAADDPSLLAAVTAHRQSNAERWRAQGWEVGVDGYPITNLTAKECKSYSVECRHTYKDTFLAWSFLTDLKEVEKEVRVLDRWDMRERAVEVLLGVTSEDVYVLSDRQVYDFKFTDKLSSDLPLISPDPSTSHWARLVSLPLLSAMPQKVLLVGSLFGSGRISTNDPRAPELRERFERALAFRNPWLMEPADAIRDRLGGGDGYVGLHARVGDGVFKSRAPENMERAWRDLCSKLKVEEGVMEEMWERVKPQVVGDDEGAGVESDRRMRKVVKRSMDAEQVAFAEGQQEPVDLGWSLLDNPAYLESSLGDDSDPARLPVPPQHRHARRWLFDSVFSFSQSSHPLQNLTCRSSLHTSPSHAAFNTPLYLATDSRSPETDHNLAIFFAAFPCTFILSDFDRPSDLNDGIVVDSVGEMGKLVNQADGLPLGRLFLPFLEAIVAAKGRETVGTYGSTFSDFAQGGLHEAYLLNGR